MNLVPSVIVRDNGSEKAYDIFSMLLKDRNIVIGDEITDDLASVVIAELLYLEAENPEEPIYLYINTPGGSCSAGLSIIDTMNFIKCPVYTFVTGTAASMGSVIFASGEKGHRLMLPHAKVMLHQVSFGAQGNIQDNVISYEEGVKINDTLMTMLGELSGGKSMEEIKKLTVRDLWLTAEESVEFGIADKVVTKR